MLVFRWTALLALCIHRLSSRWALFSGIALGTLANDMLDALADRHLHVRDTKPARRYYRGRR